MTENLHLLLPEFVLAALAILILAVDLFIPERFKSVLPWLSIGGLGGIMGLSVALLWGENTLLYGGLVSADSYSLFFKIFFFALGGVIIFISNDYVKRYLHSPGEFYAIIIFAILAMVVMAESVELLTAYIALELMSFCFYILVAYARENRKSNEAGVKYVLIGAFSSAILLYGISLLYGAVGETRFSGIERELASAMANADSQSPTLWIGLALILVGLGFKVAAVPFHMWAPDTYEGAPLPVTAFLSVGSKAAAFALLIRLFGHAFLPTIDQWQILIAILAALTMTIGNVVAIAQHNFKRLLAYSSIGHVGFMLLGIACLSVIGVESLLFYLIAYGVTTLTVFVGLIAFFNETGRDDIADFGGLADRHPFLAAAIAIGLFSLAGLPFFAGFTAKFYLFAAAGVEGLLWLAGLAIFNSLISLYYYLMIVKRMYIDPVPDWAIEDNNSTENSLEWDESYDMAGVSAPSLTPSRLTTGLLAVLVLGVIFVGVYPFPIMGAVKSAAAAIFS